MNVDDFLDELAVGLGLDDEEMIGLMAEYLCKENLTQSFVRFAESETMVGEDDPC